MFRSVIAAVILLLPSVALADSKSSAACAAQLTPEAKLIYNTAAPSIRPDTVIKDTLPGIVRPMVISGKVVRATAQDSGRAAGLCLKQLQ
ncbi:hypothetical protein HNR60_000425 [Rhodopseudomonas rhenobacensis]|uniref:Uncharacterized protein n=1 Tax=Rhodopseudomonas rhenobacensis TaxID=87461 RepID=A0A7W7Z0R0_9BRAD|nr:hypothetical protein [Rhodopseudomonas rhenobacensis]MBB5045690.1 hypothetical protein [Rhodopseudomonas rhenobacensis]